MKRLIDGDHASNNGGWQWSASTGVDAAPYFRIFNPITQSEKFDKDGQFIKKFLPNLEMIPEKLIHNPPKELRLENNYPDMIVDLKESKKSSGCLFKYMTKEINKNLKNHNLINIKGNLVDQIWINRPKKKRTIPFFLNKKQTGQDAKSKVQKVLFYLTKMKSDRYLITATDSLCWLFNIRASDIQYSPLFLSKAIIENNGQVHIFSDFISKQRIIGRQRINFHPAHHIQNYIKSCSKNNKFLADRNTIPANFVGLIKTTSKIQLIDDVIQNFKSIRNKLEIKGLRDCHIRDGAALTKSIYWLKNNIYKKKITELDASNLIDRNRKKSKYFHSLSFPTISGSGPNGAIIHYKADKKTNRRLKKDDIYLVDSGGQYEFGTTDVTRTISLALRHGAPIHYVVEQLQKDIEMDMFSFSKVIARVLKTYIKDGTVSGKTVCDNCGAEDTLIYQEGCVACTACGHSKCS